MTSLTSLSRWVAYAIKLAYRKLIQRDMSFLKIKAHEVRALSSNPGHSLIRFLSMKYLKQQSGINLLPLQILLVRHVSANSKSTYFGPNSCCPKSGRGPRKRSL